MLFLLDTNVWITYLKDASSPIRTKLQGLPSSQVACCSILRGELMHGAQKYGNRDRRMKLVEKTLAPFVSYSYDDEDAEVYAQLRHTLEKAGNIIGPYDLQIAAIALRRQLTIVTGNVEEFSRVAGLTIEDWS